MGMMAAKEGDSVVAVDIHLVKIPTPAGEVPVPLPHPFSGKLDGELSSDVNIEGKPAATVGSTASNQPAHIAQGTGFVNQPSDSATVQFGSASVMINGQPAARSGDMALTCNDPSDLPVGTVMALPCKVFMG